LRYLYSLLAGSIGLKSTGHKGENYEESGIDRSCITVCSCGAGMGGHCFRATDLYHHTGVDGTMLNFFDPDSFSYKVELKLDH
jgi:hypothetical protein